MPKSIPTLGYRSKTAACAALRDQGLETAEIAEKVGIAEKSVCALERRHRFKTGPRRIILPFTVMDKLEVAAERRGKSPRKLALAILERVAADGLIDAVMDDGESA